jgi:hypothetical protein
VTSHFELKVLATFYSVCSAHNLDTLASKLLDFTVPYYAFGTAHNLDILGCETAAHMFPQPLSPSSMLKMLMWNFKQRHRKYVRDTINNANTMCS